MTMKMVSFTIGTAILELFAALVAAYAISTNGINNAAKKTAPRVGLVGCDCGGSDDDGTGARIGR